MIAPNTLTRSAGDGMEKEVEKAESSLGKKDEIQNLNKTLTVFLEKNLLLLCQQEEMDNKLKNKQKCKEIKFIPHEPYKAAVEPYPFMLSSAFKPSSSRYRTKLEFSNNKSLGLPLCDNLQSPKSDLSIKKFLYPHTRSTLHNQSAKEFANFKFKDDISLKDDIQCHVSAMSSKLHESANIARTLKEDSIHCLKTLNLKLDKDVDVNLKEENQQLIHQNNYLLEENKKLLQEKNDLISQLNMQSQVNKELKKLLVASVGDDLQLKFELLSRDKAKLAHDIHYYSERVCHDFEQLEKLSIQCDVWRSKFLASRVMVDELANWKALLYRKYEESQESIIQLLSEHKEIKTSLLHVCRTAKRIKEKLNSGTSQEHVLNTCNFLQLSKSVELLVDSIHVILFGNRSSAYSYSDACHCEDLTQAEKHAVKVLSNTELIPDETLSRDVAAALSGSRSGLINRFHPHTKFEQLTISCCGNCKGDIKVV